MTHINSAASTEAALSLCAGDADIRILRRVSPLSDFPLAEIGDGQVRTVAVLDTETTGTDPDRDEIIDIARHRLRRCGWADRPHRPCRAGAP